VDQFDFEIIEAAFENEIKTMKTIKQGMFAVSVVAVRPLLALAILILGGLGFVLTASAADVLISSKAAPQTGTFYRMQGPGPLPFNRFPSLPLYVVDLSKNIFLIDDRSVDYDALNAKMLAEAPESDSEEQMNGPAYDYPTNVLWIELYAHDPTNALAYLTLHNTRSNYYYQLLSKLDLNDPEWTFRQIVQDVYGTNQVYFDPVPSDPQEKEFFRGVEGVTVASVYRALDAIEPNSAITNAGQTGYFQVSRLDAPDWPLSVVYRISGSASNGVDYTNLSGTITIPANEYNTYLYVSPIEDNLVEFDETVTLSLALTNGYLVDSNYASATITISDNYGTNLFTVVATNLDKPVGLDYHPPTQSLLVSVHYYSSDDPSFLRIDSNGVVTAWSGITNLTEEKKIAVVKTTANGFTQGEMFFGTGINGVIGWLSADGTVSNLNWITLTNETTETLFRGSLYVDQTGIFSNALIAVTGGSADQGGEVWRIHSRTNATRLANITNSTTPHLEGVITLTNDVQKWGPWAGKIITGAESKVPPLIHGIDTNGVVTSFDLGIEPEDFDIIPPYQDLYIADYVEGRILKLSSNLLTNFVGDMLVTQAGDGVFGGHPRKLFFAHWDGTFQIRSITGPDSLTTGIEHCTFAPINLPNIPQQ
jgi:hypothetical protein